MTALEKSTQWISPEEYIAGELRSEIKHEYIDGQVYAMAGASRTHNLIAGNAFAIIHNYLRGKRCTPFGSDMKVRLPQTLGQIFYYPDISVTCDPSDDAEHYLERPSLIIEVLSPDTRRTDLREKRLAYWAIPTLDLYMTLDQERPEALILRRKDNAWVEELVARADATVSLAPIGLSVPLTAFYEGTALG